MQLICIFGTKQASHKQVKQDCSKLVKQASCKLVKQDCTKHMKICIRDMLPMKKFGSLPPKDDPHQVWLKSAHRFWRRRWKCKKFTHDARRTKSDGNSSSSLWLGWANKNPHLRMVGGFLLGSQWTPHNKPPCSYMKPVATVPAMCLTSPPHTLEFFR